MSEGNGDRGHPCLVLDLGGKPFRFSPFACDVSCGLGKYGLYFVQVCSIYTLFVESFYHEKNVELRQRLCSASVKMVM